MRSRPFTTGLILIVGLFVLVAYAPMLVLYGVLYLGPIIGFSALFGLRDI